jgi:hypothetical protein
MRGYKVLTSVKCTTIITTVLTVTSGLGLVGVSLSIGLVMDGNKSR